MKNTRLPPKYSLKHGHDLGQHGDDIWKLIHFLSPPLKFDKCPHFKKNWYRNEKLA